MLIFEEQLQFQDLAEARVQTRWKTDETVRDLISKGSHNQSKRMVRGAGTYSASHTHVFDLFDSEFRLLPVEGFFSIFYWLSGAFRRKSHMQNQNTTS